MNTLNMDIGGDVAKNLYSLYEYLHYRLIQANINRDSEMVQEVLKHLKDLKMTWEEAIRIAAKEKIQSGQAIGEEDEDESTAVAANTEEAEDEDEDEEEAEEPEKDFVG
jgi:ribosomal protein L12E/L44/L45/RPP1/RPP2